MAHNGAQNPIEQISTPAQDGPAAESSQISSAVPVVDYAPPEKPDPSEVPENSALGSFLGCCTTMLGCLILFVTLARLSQVLQGGLDLNRRWQDLVLAGLIFMMGAVMVTVGIRWILGRCKK